MPLMTGLTRARVVKARGLRLGAGFIVHPRGGWPGLSVHIEARLSIGSMASGSIVLEAQKHAMSGWRGLSAFNLKARTLLSVLSPDSPRHASHEMAISKPLNCCARIIGIRRGRCPPTRPKRNARCRWHVAGPRWRFLGGCRSGGRREVIRRWQLRVLLSPISSKCGHTAMPSIDAATPLFLSSCLT